MKKYLCNKYESNSLYEISRFVQEYEGESKEYGNLTDIKCKNKSRIVISKKGWTSVLSLTFYNLWKILKYGKIEITLDWEEIYLAVEESIKAGYTKNVEDTKRS